MNSSTSDLLFFSLLASPRYDDHCCCKRCRKHRCRYSYNRNFSKINNSNNNNQNNINISYKNDLTIEF